jgi:hypothetical protein
MVNPSLVFMQNLALLSSSMSGLLRWATLRLELLGSLSLELLRLLALELLWLTLKLLWLTLELLRLTLWLPLHLLWLALKLLRLTLKLWLLALELLCRRRLVVLLSIHSSISLLAADMGRDRQEHYHQGLHRDGG